LQVLKVGDEGRVLEELEGCEMVEVEGGGEEGYELVTTLVLLAFN